VATPLDPSDGTQIMHIVQESFRIFASMPAPAGSPLRSPFAGRSILRFEDDGGGFDPVNEPKVLSDRHVGLKIMRERAHRIGGECRITSAPGKGTQVRLVLPKETSEERLNELKNPCLLVDDHAPVSVAASRRCLQRHDDFEVVGEAGDGLGRHQARALAEAGCRLLDLHMPGFRAGGGQGHQPRKCPMCAC
jgi:hypothetical protein